MRKIFVLFFSVFVLFSGCESLDNIPSSNFSGTDKSHTSEKNSAPEKSSSNDTSFDEAYSWRTGKAEEKMILIKNDKSFESMRVSNPANYVKRVAREINSIASSDFEKVKMAHDITTLVLKYDADSFWKNNIPSQDYRDVLKTGLAICDGYSNVFKELCDQLNFSCERIHGYARGVDIALLDEQNVEETNHAWNIVKVKDKWYLVDCTWDAGQMQGYEAKQEYRTDWLFVRPEHFIYTHLPSNKNNQLIFPRISPERFSDLPELRPIFFDSVNSIPANLKKINYCDESFRFLLDIKNGYNITFVIENIADSSEVLNCYFIKTSGSRKYATFSFPKAGQYSVQMFYWKDGAQVGEYCGEFFVESSRDSDVRYPTTYAGYGTLATIVTPTEMPLRAGASQKFSVKSNKKVVVIVTDSSQVKLANDGNGNFLGEVEIPENTKQVSVAVSDNERGKANVIAAYTVE